MFKDVVTAEGHEVRRFYELPLMRNESPALALSWTLYHAIDETSPLHGLRAEDFDDADVSLVVVVSGYDALRRKPSTPGNPMTTARFVSVTATPTCWIRPKMGGSGSITAGSMTTLGA